jgi:hypothetical protein
LTTIILGGGVKELVELVFNINGEKDALKSLTNKEELIPLLFVIWLKS